MGIFLVSCQVTCLRLLGCPEIPNVNALHPKAIRKIPVVGFVTSQIYYLIQGGRMYIMENHGTSQKESIRIGARVG